MYDYDVSSKDGEGWFYTDTVKDHFFNPRNLVKSKEEADKLTKTADGVGIEGSPACGDMMQMWIKIKDNKVAECKWQTFGCASAIASTSMYSVMLTENGGMEIEKALEIAVLRHKQKKPGKIVELENYFECNIQELAIIGDRYLTDVAYGNRYGMFAAHVQPFTSRGDNPLVKIIRPLEKSLVDLWKKSGVNAPKHSVQERYQQFSY